MKRHEKKEGAHRPFCSELAHMLRVGIMLSYLLNGKMELVIMGVMFTHTFQFVNRDGAV